TVVWSFTFSSDARMCGSFSGSAPAFSGTQYPGAIPCGKKMPMKRLFGAPAAVCANAVPAGTIASSNGSASVMPAPLRNARRGMCFFGMNMLLAPLLGLLVGRRGRCLHFRVDRLLSLRIHLSRLALELSKFTGREALLLLSR